MGTPSLWIGILAASLSGVCVLAAAYQIVSLAASIIVLAPLSTITLAAIAVRARRGRDEVLLTRLWGGVLAGLAGLLAYDLIRLLVLLTGLVPFNPFRPIEVFGLLILDRYQDDALTKAAGWAFHTWNGLAFAAMYTLAAGRGRMLWAFLWAMTLEAAMLASYPSLFHVALNWPMVAMSLIGHAAYGLAVGWGALRWVRY